MRMNEWGEMAENGTWLSVMTENGTWLLSVSLQCGWLEVKG